MLSASKLIVVLAVLATGVISLVGFIGYGLAQQSDERLRTPAERRIRATWDSTVLTLQSRAFAMSLFERFCSMSVTISHSRAVRRSKAGSVSRWAASEASRLAAGRELVLAAIGDKPYDIAREVARLRELADEGVIGGVGDKHLGFMGYSQLIRDLYERAAPEMAKIVERSRADAVLLTAG